MATKLAERLASREQLPDIAVMIRENVHRLRRVMRGLAVDQQRVLRMHGIDDCPFHDIAPSFGHSTSWAHDPPGLRKNGCCTANKELKLYVGLVRSAGQAGRRQDAQHRITAIIPLLFRR